jgi:putative sterol carrier protein/ketosteroid isomerase-like protein
MRNEWDKAFAILAPDCEWTLMATGNKFHGLMEIRAFMQSALDASATRDVPEIRNDFAVDDSGVFEYVSSGTVDAQNASKFAAMAGLPADALGGKRFSFSVCFIWHINADGLIDRINEYTSAPLLTDSGNKTNQLEAENQTIGPLKPSTNLTLDQALENIIARYNTEEVKKSFHGWVKSVMMMFPDTGKSVVFKINGDQGITLTEGEDKSAAIKLKVRCDIFIRMLSKQVDPAKAYSSGELKVEGGLRDILRFRKIIGF